MSMKKVVLAALAVVAGVAFQSAAFAGVPGGTGSAAKGWSTTVRVPNAGHVQDAQTAATAALISQTSPQTYAQIARLQAQETILAEEVKVEAEKRELAKLKANIRKLSGGLGGGGLMMNPGSVPMVIRIEGSEPSLSALIELPSGGLLRVKKGDVFASIGRIVDVSSMGVTVLRHGKRHRIEFASPAVGAQQSANSGGGSGPVPNGAMTPPPVPIQ